MIRAPIVLEIDSHKKKNPSPTVSTTIIDFETGEIVCQNCGIVLQDNISFDGRDDNTFPKSTHTSQVSNRSTLRFHDMGLATIIDKSNHDSKGRPIEYKMKQDMRRMRLWDTRSPAKNMFGKNLRIALSEMEKLKEKLSLSDCIIERAAYIYRKAAKIQLTRGGSVRGILRPSLKKQRKNWIKKQGMMMTIIDNIQRFYFEKRSLTCNSSCF